MAEQGRKKRVLPFLFFLWLAVKAVSSLLINTTFEYGYIQKLFFQKRGSVVVCISNIVSLVQHSMSCAPPIAVMAVGYLEKKSSVACKAKFKNKFFENGTI